MPPKVTPAPNPPLGTGRRGMQAGATARSPRSARAPVPPSSARDAPLSARGRKITTPRVGNGAMLFAEVFGGEQSPRDELPTSVSPPFSDGAEEETAKKEEEGATTGGGAVDTTADDEADP